MHLEQQRLVGMKKNEERGLTRLIRPRKKQKQPSRPIKEPLSEDIHEYGGQRHHDVTCLG